MCMESSACQHARNSNVDMLMFIILVISMLLLPISTEHKVQLRPKEMSFFSRYFVLNQSMDIK